MPWTGRACAESCSRHRPRRATACSCSATSPKRSPIPIWRMSGPRKGPTCAFRRRAKAPKWRCSACSTGRVATSLCTPAGPNEARTSSLSIALLEEIDRRYGPKLSVAIQPLVLVLDNGPIHTSKASRAALAARAHWLRVEWLPNYAPELNDIEGLWRDLKRHHLAHQTFNGPNDLDRAIHEAVGKLNTERNRHPLANHRIAA